MSSHRKNTDSVSVTGISGESVKAQVMTNNLVVDGHLSPNDTVVGVQAERSEYGSETSTVRINSRGMEVPGSSSDALSIRSQRRSGRNDGARGNPEGSAAKRPRRTNSVSDQTAEMNPTDSASSTLSSSANADICKTALQRGGVVLNAVRDSRVRGHSKIEITAAGENIPNIATNVGDRRDVGSEDIRIEISLPKYEADVKAKFQLLAEDSCYNVEDGEGGCLIISNYFDDDESKRKYGNNYTKNQRFTHSETARLKGEFEKRRFRVRVEQNVKSTELPRIVAQFREDVEKNDYHSAFILVSSHGGGAPDSVVMDDLVERDLRRAVVYPFTENADDKHQGRPKVFLFNVCRTWEKRPALTQGERREEKDRRDTNHTRQLHNTLICFSTLPYDYAWREDGASSSYFQVFLQGLRGGQRSLRKILEDMYLNLVGEDGKPFTQTCTVEIVGFFKDYKFPNVVT